MFGVPALPFGTARMPRIWTLSVEIIGVRQLHGLITSKAVIAMILALIIPLVIVGVLFAVFFMPMMQVPMVYGQPTGPRMGVFL
ncbi:MAG: hypothetical protein ACP5E9_09350 [Candidatus Methanospirareceae archaeon]